MNMGSIRSFVDIFVSCIRLRIQSDDLSLLNLLLFVILFMSVFFAILFTLYTIVLYG